jgi:hypothetical protein
MSRREIPRNYAQAAERLNRSRRGRPPVANNTHLHASANGVGMVHHRTEIVWWCEDGQRITVSNGGWGSSSTRERIDSALPVSLSYRTAFRPHLHDRNTNRVYAVDSGRTHITYDGWVWQVQADREIRDFTVQAALGTSRYQQVGDDHIGLAEADQIARDAARTHTRVRILWGDEVLWTHNVSTCHRSKYGCQLCDLAATALVDIDVPA